MKSAMRTVVPPQTFEKAYDNLCSFLQRVNSTHIGNDKERRKLDAELLRLRQAVAVAVAADEAGIPTMMLPSACDLDGWGVYHFVGSEGTPMIDEMRQRFPELLLYLGKPPAPGTKRRKKARGKVDTESRPLTAKETEVVRVVSDCGGNFAKAGRQLGIDRKSVSERYYNAYKKMGIDVPTHVRSQTRKHTTQKLPDDHRGQADISKEDDRRT